MMKQLLSKQNRALITELVRTDFKLKYQGSVLGYAWSLLRPLFMFMILYFVFTRFIPLGDSIEHYPIYLLLGVVLWQFFTDMTNQSLVSVVNRGDLIRKIRIPRWMIVLTSSFSAVINLSLNLIVVTIFMIINGVSIGFSLLWLPVAIAEIYVFGLGISLILAAMFVKYRDISFVWEVFTQAGFYLTPIIYPLAMVSVTIQKALLLSPVAQAIQDARNQIVTNDAVTISEAWGTKAALLIPLSISLFVLLMGVLYFKKESKFFAENL